jgi:hypothetical protein
LQSTLLQSSQGSTERRNDVWLKNKTNWAKSTQTLSGSIPEVLLAPLILWDAAGEMKEGRCGGKN